MEFLDQLSNSNLPKKNYVLLLFGSKLATFYEYGHLLKCDAVQVERKVMSSRD